MLSIFQLCQVLVEEDKILVMDSCVVNSPTAKYNCSRSLLRPRAAWTRVILFSSCSAV